MQTITLAYTFFSIGISSFVLGLEGEGKRMTAAHKRERLFFQYVGCYTTPMMMLCIKTMANCTIALGVLLDILNITWLQAFTSNPPWVIPLNRMLQTCYLDTKPLKIPQNLTFKPTSLCDTCSKYELMV